MSFVVILSLIITAVVFAPFVVNMIKHGIVFSGKGDGFTQLIPFQKYLYHQYTHFNSFYDVAFGLGGDYSKGLSYYYSTSPLLICYFFLVKISSQIFHFSPDSIKFWGYNQIIIAYIRVLLTTIVSYYMFKYLNPKYLFAVLATLMYALSTVTIYYNFTWSFYGDVLILLPLSILGMEHFFRERKIGLFIIAITLTLFTNFYFSYYECIILSAYLIYRVIFTYHLDIVTRLQKIYLLVIAAGLSLMTGVLGFYTGVSAVMSNDRQLNPHLKMSMLIDFQEKYHIFSNGFYITISIVTFIALFAFNLYKHYFYRLFAVFTWVLLIGSLTPYFDSFFNGFSLPARRWVYILCLTSSILIALFIQHLSEVSTKQYLYTACPAVVIMFYMYFAYEGHMSWMWITLIIIIVMFIVIWRKSLLSRKSVQFAFIGLVFVQQLMMIKNYHDTHMHIYERTIQSMDKDNYHSAKLQQKFNHLQHKKDPFSRIDYLSFSALNSPIIYGFRGISLYSSLFDGSILKYYDNTMQIAQPIDKNSTYRLLGNRANLMALWDVQDRFKNPKDDNIPYGFKTSEVIKGTEHKYQHSVNQTSYPSAHITNKVYDNKALRSPIEREHAMLKGVVLNDTTSTNAKIQHNINYADDITENTHNSQLNKHMLTVHEKDGGIHYKVPKNIAKKYKDLYFEIELELKAPDKRHKVQLNDFTQKRNSLSYSYRRVVNPTTIRVKADKDVKLKLSKGRYRYKLKGVYGEDYQALNKATKDVNKVDIKKNTHGYTITKNKQDHGYLVLPIPFSNGLHATVDGKNTKVQQGNGIQTIIPVSKGERKISLGYTPPHLKLLIMISVIGAIASIIFTRYLRRSIKKD
ncbi:YfhO family protein [Staphylococcus kloosii]|uniref:YfhO family protein n=1 Tax=Staphylococcus kloosii TaxID=29384 RepID=UPI001E51FC3D|nr:YfhO family protein [Staphylococcus kloosii]